MTLEDGSVYEVRWLLSKHGDSYKVRDAMVVGFWMTPFLKQLFEDYIAQNGGNPQRPGRRPEPLISIGDRVACVAPGWGQGGSKRANGSSSVRRSSAR